MSTNRIDAEEIAASVPAYTRGSAEMLNEASRKRARGYSLRFSRGALYFSSPVRPGLRGMNSRKRDSWGAAWAYSSLRQNMKYALSLRENDFARGIRVTATAAAAIPPDPSPP